MNSKIRTFKKSWMNIVSLAPVMLLLTALILGVAASPARAATQPVTVTINYLEQLGDPDVSSRGDFYAKVFINGEQENTPALDFGFPDSYIVPTGQLLSSPWVVTVDVPTDAVTVPVRIEVWESDWPDDDDQADAVPGSDDFIELEVNMQTAKWTGNVNWPESCTNGSTDLDGRGVRICFDIGTLSANGDLDGDGLLDTWEQRGVDFTQDGIIDIDLPILGANPFRKDIFVELDYLVAGDHSHGPRQDSMEDAVAAFARAPVPNLDGTNGVQLHVDVGPLYGAGAIAFVPGPGGTAGTYGDFGGGNQIAEAGNEIIESFSSPKGIGTPFADLKANFFDDARSPIFHYAIFGHQTNSRMAMNDCTSGEASDIPGHDFMVTLGGSPVGVPTFPCWGANPAGLSVGSRSEQAGTFMHELGHVIGLQHGGDESIFNYKPNYLSVMNYSFQLCSVRSSPNGVLPGGCDYSRIALPPFTPAQLDESSLDECIGIDAGLFGFGPVNWDGDTLLEGITNCQPPNSANVQVDINTDGLQTLLRGFDDWSNLNYAEGISGPGLGAGVPDEADPQTIQEAQDVIAEAMAPGISVEKTGPATAEPGEVLTYTTEISNNGKGPAFEMSLTDTAPDRSTQVLDLGAVVVGETKTQTSTFTIPLDACPGDSTEASAVVHFEDFVSQPLSASDSAPLEILDVSAPTITLSVSPTILWPPNHKFVDITAAITVTDNCDPNPTVTLVSITSNEPATGILGNGDKGPDVQGASYNTDDRAFSLRAERATGGNHTGRVYTIKYRVMDASGNFSEATATVKVPTSNSGNP
jgi:uncharacterized repeat protein (TIGR01451 family)